MALFDASYLIETLKEIARIDPTQMHTLIGAKSTEIRALVAGLDDDAMIREALVLDRDDASIAFGAALVAASHQDHSACARDSQIAKARASGTSAKEQRDQENRRHEHQVQALQVELRQANETLNGKNHELMQLNRENARMTEQIGQLGKEIRQAQSDHRVVAQQIEELKANAKDFQALEAQRSKELLVIEQLRTDLAAASQAADRERDRRREAETSTIGLKARVQALTDVMAQLRRTTPTIESDPGIAP